MSADQRRRVGALAIMIAVVLALPAAVTGAEAAFPGRNGSIVFASQRANGGWELYAVGARGGAARQLTAHSPLPGDPVWLPGGHTLAFLREDGAVFLVNAETGRRHQTPLVAGYDVAWAPQGRRLVYSFGLGPDQNSATDLTGLWIADISGSHPRRLTSGVDTEPVWSPDGTTIAFTRSLPTDSSYDERIYLIRSDGTHLRLLAGGSQPVLPRGTVSDTVWSPDGSMIAFNISTDNAVNLYVVSVNGGRVRSLGRGAESLAWSPDGSKLAFTTRTDDNRGFNLYVFSAHGGPVSSLGEGFALAWSPDGSMLAFTTRTDDNRDFNLYVFSANGGRVRSLGEGSNPAWSPDSRQLVVGKAGTLSVLAADGSSGRALPSDGCDDSPYRWAPKPTITVSTSCESGGTRTDGFVQVDPTSGGRRWLVQGQAGGLSWSPDGTKLAFFLQPEDEDVLEVANADGSDAHELLVPPSGYEKNPAWSPDGRTLAVNAERPNPLPGAPAILASPVKRPAWSPDGTQLVGEDLTQVVIVNVKTGERNVIYEDEGYGEPSLSDAAWSPDGRWIAFATESPDLGIVRYDVTRGRFVGNHGIYEAAHPAWSPDGKRLAFDNNSYSLKRTNAIFVAAADGRHAKRIAANASEPAWSPDGRQIAFVRIVGRTNSEVYVMNADGTHQRRLTFNRGPDVDPDWQPVH